MVDPTIRKDNAEIWLTFNPQYRYQIAWQLAQNKNQPGYWVRQVNWYDNQFFPDRLNRVRLRNKEDNPQRYSHVWEGQPDDASEARKVLPHNILRQCVESWERRPPQGAFGTAGFDVADTGADANALVNRYGPELHSVDLGAAARNGPYRIQRARRRILPLATVSTGLTMTRAALTLCAVLSTNTYA